ncbi:peptidylprolyl isomerase [Geomonas anaerohicana]|uniref:Peptidylprolyl isomerase n=1 Tax=Geomonas anaerohicana TaxID=2798583 RepID=A0ABS0YEQ1_9BACT|nr:peptidylprolyl isomerase [Geomonas anaerohicana]MBJ6750770.1 peptidylprolyl isomerase [Geomonas anaerohicana]
MSPRSRAIALVIAIALLLIPLFACNQTDQKQQWQPPPSLRHGSATDPVQKVNGNTITRAELDRAVKALAGNRQLRQPLSPAMLRGLQAEALEQLQASELLYQAALSTGTVPQGVEQQVAQAIARDRARHLNDAAFYCSLQEAGLTLPQLEQMIRKELVINNFVEKRFGSQVRIDTKEAQDFYEANRERFKTGCSARASQILVVVSGEERDKERARERAEVLLHRVREGESFSILAQSHSDCPSRARGGDLGFFSRGELDPRLEQAIFALKPGEISDIVQTSYGFHILKLTEKRAPRPKSYQEAKTAVYASLKKEKMAPLVAAYVTELRSRAKLEAVGLPLP